MFWGLNLKPNRKYTQTTTKSFHISGAALDGESSSGGTTQIYISSENQKFLICTLRKGGPEQVMLDLNFAEGEEICFQSIGSGNVSLAGYIIDNFMDGGADGEEEESDLEDEQMPTDLRNALNQKKAKKVQKAEAVAGDDDDEDDEEEDPDFNGIEMDGSDDDDDDLSVEDEDDNEDDDDDDDDEDDDNAEEDDDDESEDDEIQQPKPKQLKLEKPAKQQNGNVAAKDGSAKKNKKEPQQQQKEQQQKQPKKDIGTERTIAGGVKIIDLREGAGPEAKVGKRAQVYYEGRLKSNNKVFDSMKTGAGFKFPLGRGEVIKAWDVGVVGMKVGGKRRIICPPHMAYGVRGSPPTIPPNSTLVFEVELKGVN